MTLTPSTDAELIVLKADYLGRAMLHFDTDRAASAHFEEIHNLIVDEQMRRAGLKTRYELAVDHSIATADTGRC